MDPSTERTLRTINDRVLNARICIMQCDAESAAVDDLAGAIRLLPDGAQLFLPLADAYEDYARALAVHAATLRRFAKSVRYEAGKL